MSKLQVFLKGLDYFLRLKSVFELLFLHLQFVNKARTTKGRYNDGIIKEKNLGKKKSSKSNNKEQICNTKYPKKTAALLFIHLQYHAQNSNSHEKIQTQIDLNNQ